MPSQVPPFELLVAPGAATADLYPSWSDVTVDPSSRYRVRHFTYRRGKDTELDSVQPGTAAFELNNMDRLFDPMYSTGVFYGKHIANAQVWLKATISGTTYPMFRGYIQDVDLEYQGPTAAVATAACVDRQSSLAESKFTGSFSEELSGTRIFNVLAAAGLPTLTVGGTTGWKLGTSRLGTDTYLAANPVPLNDLDPGQAIVAAIDATEQSVTQHINAVVASDPGLFFFDGNGLAVFRDRSRYTPDPDAAVFTLTDDPSLEDATHLVYSDIKLSYGKSIVKNDVTVKDATGGEVRNWDLVSMDSFDTRALSVDTWLRPVSEVPDGWHLCNWYLKSLKDERVRIKSVKLNGTSLAVLARILSIEVGDRVVATRTPHGATPLETLTQDSVVEGISVEGTPSVWSAELLLAPLFTVTGGGWVLGTSTLSNDTRLVYA